jgi:hypothetical protein
VNCLWLQEQCARKIVPLTKIPGEDNSADLMTKHLSIAMILRHMSKLNLAHVSGRSEAAAKLHALREVEAPRKSVSFSQAKHYEVDARALSSTPSVSRRAVNDYWSERGEHGRWVRTHVTPRVDRFDPWRAPRGPGRKTRLKPERITQGIYEGNNGEFQETDQWQNAEENIRPVSHPWTGRTIFRVDKGYSKEYGTDQRRQRATVANHIDELG